MEELGEMLPTQEIIVRRKKSGKITRVVFLLLVVNAVLLTGATFQGFISWNIFPDSESPKSKAEHATGSCTYAEKELLDVASALAASSKYLKNILREKSNLKGKKSNGKVLPSMTARNSDDLCQLNLKIIQQQLENITVGAMTLSSEALAHHISENKVALEELELQSERLEGMLQGLFQLEYQESAVKRKYKGELRRYKLRVGNVIEKLKEKKFIQDVVWNVKNGSLEDAVTKLNSFDEDADTISEHLRKVVRMAWQFSEERTLEFIEKVESSQKPIGYLESLLQVSNLEKAGGETLLKVAYKIREGMQENEKLYSPLKEMLPVAIKNLMWHETCAIQNKKTGHYMKLAEVEGRGECMTGDSDFSTDQKFLWRLAPFQDSVSSPVRFRIENVGMSKYLGDGDNAKGITSVNTVHPGDEHAMWEIDFSENKIGSLDDSFVVYIRTRSETSSRYLYEPRPDWDSWGHGESEECVQLSEKTKYDEGTWLFHFAPYHHHYE